MHENSFVPSASSSAVSSLPEHNLDETYTVCPHQEPSDESNSGHQREQLVNIGMPGMGL